MIYLKSLTTTYSLDAHRNHTQDERGVIYDYPFTDISDSIRIGLNPQRISFTPYITNLITIPWQDIISISFDNVTWQKVLFMDFSFDTIPGGGVYPFTINMIVSPLRLGTVHASGDIWGLNATPNLVNAGNHKAYAKLVYQAPRLYFPLTQNLIDFAGSSIALTNASSKNYKGVSYPANTPIFNAGLYLSNEFTDVAKLTFAALTAHTIIAQIKSTRYPTDWIGGSGAISPSDWVVGGSGGNLLTANQSNAETDLTGVGSFNGTLSRTTVAGEFYAGIAGFKLVSTTGDLYIYMTTRPAVTAGKYYCFSVYAKASIAKNWYTVISWYNAAHDLISSTYSTSVPASTSFTRLFVIGQAPTNTVECTVVIVLEASVTGDILYADNLMLEQASLVIGGSGGNLLTANQSNAETDTMGIDGYNGTLSRTTVAGEFYAGIAGFKLVSTGANDIYIRTILVAGITAGKYYCFSAYVKSSTIARNWYVKIEWINAADEVISELLSTAVAASTSFTRLLVIGKAPALTTKFRVSVYLVATVATDVLYVDNLMMEQINETTVTVWDDGLTNCLWIDIPNSLLVWKDYVHTFWCTFPTIQFLTENSGQTRKVVTIVATQDGDNKGLHCKYEGGAFADATSDALDALVWTNEITLGRFDGSLFNLIQYPYILTATEYGDLDFSLNALRFNNFYIANKTAGMITFDEGKLTDENGNDISGLTSGDLLEEGTIEMTEGLSAKWTASIFDCFFP